MRSFIQTMKHGFHRTTHEQPVVVKQQVGPALSGRRYSMFESPAHAVAERKRIADRELTQAAVKIICLNERNLQLLEQERAKLIETNIALRGQITDLTEVLEKQWLLRGERVAQAIAVLFEKFQGLHQNLSDRYTKACETQKIEQQCIIKNEKPSWNPDYDNSALTQRLGVTHLFARGQSRETIMWYAEYAYLYPAQRFVVGLAQLHQALGKETFPILIKEKVQSIKNGILSQASALEPTSTALQQVEPSTIALMQLLHDNGDVHLETIQGQMSAQQTLQRSNLQLREENTRLEKEKEDLRNMETRFVSHFSRLQCFSLTDFHSSTKSFIKWRKHITQDNPNFETEIAKLLDSRYSPRSFAEGMLTIRLELLKVVPPALQEMDQLVSEILEGCPLPTPTT